MYIPQDTRVNSRFESWPGTGASSVIYSQCCGSASLNADPALILMHIRIWILLLLKVMGICDHCTRPSRAGLYFQVF
jgi:hypothetical protein